MRPEIFGWRGLLAISLVALVVLWKDGLSGDLPYSLGVYGGAWIGAAMLFLVVKAIVVGRQRNGQR